MRRLAAAGVAVLALAGCQASYYAQLARGQYELIMRREPIADLLARPETDAALKLKLERALDARRFASEVLALPENGSYRLYADLKRPYALWNVFATPEFSMAAREWCYPFAGCMAYRGYYAAEAARAEVEALRGAGLDAHIGGVSAYSTLGWFDDPVLNTIMVTDEMLVGTIFHELAHQQRFVKGDTGFNESLATFIEHEGLRQYYRDEPARLDRLAQRQRRDREFVGLMLATRHRLEQLYALSLPADEMRARKRTEFERLKVEYAEAKRGWGGDGAYDGWLQGEMNNARLLPFGLYHEWVPAFAELFRRSGRRWPEFHREVAALAAVDVAERRVRLEGLVLASRD
jgi:predicted aminopeptidase